MATLISFVIVAGGVIIYFSFLLKREKADRNKQQAQMDEFIYDPDSGARMTLEQAEKGHYIASDIPFRIKSDEEIDSYYSGQEKEIEYIKRDFSRNAHAESEDEEIVDLILESEMSRQFETFHIQHLWELSPDRFIGVLRISNTYAAGRMSETVVENQVVAVLDPLTTSSLKELLEGFDWEKTSGRVIIRLAKEITYEDFNQVRGQLEKH